MQRLKVHRRAWPKDRGALSGANPEARTGSGRPWLHVPILTTSMSSSWPKDARWPNVNTAKVKLHQMLGVLDSGFCVKYTAISVLMLWNLQQSLQVQNGSALFNSLACIEIPVAICSEGLRTVERLTCNNCLFVQTNLLSANAYISWRFYPFGYASIWSTVMRELSFYWYWHSVQTLIAKSNEERRNSSVKLMNPSVQTLNASHQLY